MKTPEEIKKGLLHCEREKCKECPYYDKCTMAWAKQRKEREQGCE